ncbi:protein-L-isoaspartate O-methyltransferase [Sphingomonas floccifaciens]|uniref:Protein-L-isoaspartate O-methyltransferase n=1 Tax=Sphingomonas floccifaciens TaxID=1844115 RepID=A0ABW4NG67_9SPHN
MTMMGNGTEAAARAAMVVSQLRTSAVSDPRVIAAMAEVPREAFVATDAAELAYRDRPVPLGSGREQNAPLATGRLLTAAELSPADRVLLIGAGRGYTAAVLAELVGSVVAVESEAELADAARAALAGRGNVTVVQAPLTEGAPDQAPYDVLIVDGAVEQLPEALLAQVRTGGRVLSGLIDGGVARLASGVKSDGFVLVPFADIDCVTLPGFERPRAFHFPG